MKMFKIIDRRGELKIFPNCITHGWEIAGWGVHGQKYYWTENELLDLPLSNTLKKRIPGLRLDTKVYIYSSGKYDQWYLCRMTDEEIQLVAELEIARQQLETATHTFRLAAPSEYQTVLDAQKVLRNIQKQTNKLGLK